MDWFRDGGTTTELRKLASEAPVFRSDALEEGVPSESISSGALQFRTASEIARQTPCEARWAAQLEQNVELLLTTSGGFYPVKKIKEVYGDTFGEARQMHLRRALKNLSKSGKTSSIIKGDLDMLWLKP